MRVRKTLIRLQKWQVDGKRKQLGELQGLRDQLLFKIQAVDETVAREQKIVSAAAEGAGELGMPYGAFAQAAIWQKQNLLRSLESILEQISAAELEVQEAYNALKRQETAAANQETRDKRTHERREQVLADDHAIENHLRKNRRR